MTLMGIDFLDLHFKLEKTLGVKIPRGSFDSLIGVRKPPDITAGEFHRVVLGIYREISAERRVQRVENDVRCERCGITLGEIPVPGFCRRCGYPFDEDDYVWYLVKVCIADAFGVEVKDIYRDSLLIKDLGMS